MDIPKEFLSKEFLSQFKSREEIDSFLKELHVRVYEQVLEVDNIKPRTLCKPHQRIERMTMWPLNNHIFRILKCSCIIGICWGGTANKSDMEYSCSIEQGK